MKITRNDINILAEAIVNDVYNDQKIGDLINKDEEKMWNDFAKSKKRKDTLKLLKLWKSVEWFKGIAIVNSKFFWDGIWCWTSTIIDEESTKQSFKASAYYVAKKNYPDRYTVINRIKTLLTVKILWGKDIETVMKEIKDMLKKEYKCL